MRAGQPFGLTSRAALALLVAAAFPSLADAASVARVEFSIGQVSAAGSDGKTRAVVKGSVLESGETIETGDGGRAQLRFTDGAYMSLQPSTAFRVDDYRWDGNADGNEKGIFSLLKGGLRTITGAIGRVNRASYQVRTATATIGIRGTEYLVEYTNSIRVVCYNGELGISNDKVIDFPVTAGRSVVVKTRDSAPVGADPPVQSPAPTAQQRIISDTEQRFTNVLPVDTFQSENATKGGTGFGLPAGSGYALAFSIGGEGGFCQIGCAAGGNSATCGQSIVTKTSGGGLTWTQGNAFVGDFIGPGPVVFEPGGLKFQGGSVGGVLGWGYFTDGRAATFTSSESEFLELAANEGFHGILYIPTPNMPTTGTVTYTMIPGAFTTPTFSNNVGGGGLTPGGMVNSATMTANFGTGGISGGASFSFPGGNAYQMNFSSVAINGAGITGGAIFSRTAGSGSSCASSCSATIAGGFAGTASGAPVAPPYAGYAYKVFVTGGSGFQVNGAIASQR